MDKVPDLKYETISIGKPIGRGTFGEVYRGTWDGQPVAVKRFLQLDNTNAFEKEAVNLSIVRHPNIIQLYGVSIYDHGRYIIMEYADNGSLHDFLHNGMNAGISSLEQKLNWALQCAAGVSYLHSRTPILLHRDLKPLNLLLSDQYRKLKICDFGQVVELRNTMTKDRGTPRWTAPEIYQGTHYNEKCDVFSWGIIFWEILSGEIPYGRQRRTNDIIQAQIGGERPTVPEEWRPAIKDLIARCWTADPNERPSMAEVVKEMIAINNE